MEVVRAKDGLGGAVGVGAHRRKALFGRVVQRRVWRHVLIVDGPEVLARAALEHVTDVVEVDDLGHGRDVDALASARSRFSHAVRIACWIGIEHALYAM